MRDPPTRCNLEARILYIVLQGMARIGPDPPVEATVRESPGAPACPLQRVDVRKKSRSTTGRTRQSRTRTPRAIVPRAFQAENRWTSATHLRFRTTPQTARIIMTTPEASRNRP